MKDKQEKHLGCFRLVLIPPSSFLLPTKERVVSKGSFPFIPLAADELLALLLADPALPADGREPLRGLAAGLARAHDAAGPDRRLALRGAYWPFDPDPAPTSLTRHGEMHRQAQFNELLRDLNWVLDRAGFRHVSREEFDPMLQGASDWGIRMSVDFSVFEHLAVF